MILNCCLALSWGSIQGLYVVRENSGVSLSADQIVLFLSLEN